MYIYIVRHGQTDWNKQVKLQGRSDIPLNDEGRRLASLTGRGLRNIEFERVFSSPLSRARETAELICGNRDVGICIDERIVEMSFGSYEGMEFDKARLEDYGELHNFFRHPHLYVPPEGGESIKDLRERTSSFMKELIASGIKGNVLIVTHGAAISGLLAYVNDSDDEHLWGEGVHKNCAVTILKTEENRAKVIELSRVFG